MQEQEKVPEKQLELNKGGFDGKDQKEKKGR